MSVFQLIAVICPAAIPTILESKKTDKNIPLIYLTYLLFINLLNILVVYFIFSYNELTFTASFTIKYICLGIANGFICYIISLLVKKYCTIIISFEEKKKKDKNEKKTK